MEENVGATVKKAALKAMKKKPLPCKKKKTNRVAIFSPWRKKMVSVEPYGATAKRLYRWYIQELDFDAAWVAPPNLKFHEASGRFTRVKPKVETRTAYKKYLSCHRIHNIQKVMGFEGFELLRSFRAQLQGALTEHGGLKAHCAYGCLFDKVIEGVAYAHDHLVHKEFPMLQITNAAQLDGALSQMIDQMRENVPEVETRGTGWKFTRVSFLDVHIAKYKPLKGSSYIPLPDALALKKAVVNVKNTDQRCFMWAVLPALFSVGKNA